MQSFNETRILPYNYADLFSMVLDIESYPDFLPWCEKTKIITKSEKEIIAELTVKFNIFSEKYISRVKTINDKSSYQINSEAIEGPFKYLRNTWHFQKINAKSTEVCFFIDFSFESAILEKFMGLIFMNVAKKMINAFEDRAYNLFRV